MRWGGRGGRSEAYVRGQFWFRLDSTAGSVLSVQLKTPSSSSTHTHSLWLAAITCALGRVILLFFCRVLGYSSYTHMIRRCASQQDRAYMRLSLHSFSSGREREEGRGAVSEVEGLYTPCTGCLGLHVLSFMPCPSHPQALEDSWRKKQRMRTNTARPHPLRSHTRPQCRKPIKSSYFWWRRLL